MRHGRTVDAARARVRSRAIYRMCALEERAMNCPTTNQGRLFQNATKQDYLLQDEHFARGGEVACGEGVEI